MGLAEEEEEEEEALPGTGTEKGEEWSTSMGGA
jgi:hypothetical protein